MKKSLFILAALMNMTLVNTASAWCCTQNKCPGGNFYVGGIGGYNWTAKNGFKVPKNPVPPSSSAPVVENTSPQPHMSLRQWKPGYVAGGNIGYRWNNGFHLEAEGSFRYNKRKGNSTTKGNHQSMAYLANAFYQFKLGCLPLEMYFGGGLGYVNCYHKHHGHTSNDRDGFAWQFMGGFAYPIYDRIDITVDYRYFTEQRAKFRNNSVTGGFRFYI